MTRFSAILLLLTYSFSVTGASVYLHYCCGKTPYVVAHEDVQTNLDDCSLCVTHHEPVKTEDNQIDQGCHQTTATNDPCYSVKVELKKTTEEHLASSDKNNIPKIYPLELVVFSLIGTIDFAAKQPVAFANNGRAAPPLSVPLFIQHCTYLI